MLRITRSSLVCTCTRQQVSRFTTASIERAESVTSAPTAGAPRSKKEKAVSSICEAGTVMKGLNIMKAGTDPVAMPNADYPAWLWTITDKANQGAKKDARKANRMAIKRKNFFAGRL